MLCLFSYAFYFIGDIIGDDYFNDEVTPSLKANDRLNFAQDVPLKNVREKGKP